MTSITHTLARLFVVHARNWTVLAMIVVGVGVWAGRADRTHSEVQQACIQVRLSDHNLFLLEDYSQGHDVQGRVAAGGNITLNNFAVGMGLPDGNTSQVLVAGNNLLLSNGGVHGDAWYGGSYSPSSTVTFNPGTASRGTPIDFVARGAELRGLSAQLAAMTANGTTTRLSWGGVMLRGTGPQVNVFDVDASAFTGAKLLSIEAPAGSLAVINIHGAAATFTGFSTVFSGGIAQQGVLYNFVDGTTVTADGYGFKGTVLAPNADVRFSNGIFEGGIYARSMVGNAEGHISPLTDRDICIPTGPPNSPPTVAITSPANGSSYTAPATIVMEATASDSDDTVSRVEFFRDGVLVGTATSAPYTVTLTGVPEGNHSMTAKATDSRGASTTAAPVGVVVTALTLCSARPLPPEPPPTHQPLEEDEAAWVSEAVAALEGASPTSFNPVASPVSFKLSCPTLDMTPDSVVVYLNNKPLPFASLGLAPDRVTVTGGIPSGRNELELLARDIYGFTIQKSVVLWAGTYTVPVVVLDPAGNPASGATVTASLSDDPRVTATLVTGDSGRGMFTNLPNRSYNMVATAAGNMLATHPTSVFDGTVLLRLTGLVSASPIDNNDFSLGLEGWNIGSAPAFIIDHIEGPMGLTAAHPPAVKGERASRTMLSQQLSGLPGPALTAKTLAKNNDLVLATSGEGQQSISRTFQVEAGIKSVTVRYRFLTTEVPGGYFGTEYNDFYNVSVRTANSGQVVNEGNSMNGLGLAAFDGAGATSWREVEIQIPKNGDTVQVDLAVANVADDLLDSYVIVDLIKKKKLSITQIALNDIDDTTLSYLSASSHSYFGGMTRVHGTMTIVGDSDDSLEELKLEVLEGGNVIATGTLTSGLTETLYDEFGDSEEIKLETSQLFFEIPGGELAATDQGSNGTLSLRVKAKSEEGDTDEKDIGNVTKVALVTGIARYGGRDENRGGDDWAKPSVRLFIQGAGLTWGDFSNMNAGSFAPDHQTHQTGNSADGWFNGFNDRNAATAATIIGHLNTYGTRIRTVYVTFAPNSAFATAISNVTLTDGRPANQVIRNVGGHTTHFHWEVTDN